MNIQFNGSWNLSVQSEPAVVEGKRVNGVDTPNQNEKGLKCSIRFNEQKPGSE